MNIVYVCFLNVELQRISQLNESIIIYVEGTQ